MPRERPTLRPWRTAARAGPARAASLLTARERAGYLRNPATTVVQGAIVPAVLETAIDSTRPAIVRAMVSRDIRGFDGSRVLIPRGSRLVGEYRADTLSGQKRVMVSWSRLIRPDGATISLDSPSGDLLGRGGIKGKVDTHFFERFGSALLQSVLDIGVNVASSSLSDSPVFVGVPGNVGSAVGESTTSKTTAPPTIKVRQGATIAVLVARDLDFTSVENR